MQHIPSSQPVVGIDVSKKTLDVFIDLIEQRFSIDNSDDAIAALVDRLRLIDVGLVVIEAKLVGVAPLNRDSGQFRGQRAIAGGRADVRSTLYMLAHNAVLYCPRFKRFFETLCARGKKYKIAMTACMRKLLVTLNQMIKTRTHWNQNFDPELT